jgi:alkylhydroperoxidase family enzyme
MARVEGIRAEDTDDRSRAVLDAQASRYGAPLNPYPILARRPSILRAVRGMWAGLDESGLLDPALRAMVNRRVASLNRCEF